MLFCSTQKTLILGAPLLHALFGRRSPDELVVVLLPLTLYHMLELVVGLLGLAPRLRRWVETDGGATKEIECRPMIAPVAPGDDAG